MLKEHRKETQFKETRRQKLTGTTQFLELDKLGVAIVWPIPGIICNGFYFDLFCDY